MLSIATYLTFLSGLAISSRRFPIAAFVTSLVISILLITVATSPVEQSFIFFHYCCAAFWRFLDAATGRFILSKWLDRVVHHLTFSGLELGSSRPAPVHINWNALLQLLISVSSIFSLLHALSLTTHSVLGTSVILAFLCFFAFWTASSTCIFIFAILGYELEPFFHDFWNAHTVGQVWTKWNVHFQRVLFHRVHLPLKSRLPRWQSQIFVFSASASAHWIPHVFFFGGDLRHVLFWNVFFILQGGVLVLERRFPLPLEIHRLAVKTWVLVWSTLLFVPIAHALIQ